MPVASPSGGVGLNSLVGLLIGAVAGTGFSAGSFILLLENISSCLNIGHRIYVFTIHPNFIM